MNEENNPLKIAWIRLDGLGDLLCTLPSERLTVSHTVQLYWLVHSPWNELWAYAPSLTSRVLSISSKTSAWEKFKACYSIFKREQFSAICIFFAPWWLSLAAWMAGIPLRVGRKSQWWSYVFLTHGLRQKRSRSQRHEAEYNQELATFFFQALATRIKHISPPNPLEFTKTYESHASKTPPIPILPQTNTPPSLEGSTQLKSRRYIVIHPGMKGSAGNWQPTSYSKLIEQLAPHFPVVVTGTPADAPWINPLLESWGKHPRVSFFIGRPLSDLIEVLSQAGVVIAPSTGIAHLSSACGTWTIGLYPDITAQSPRRWRPLGENVIVLTSSQPQLVDIRPVTVAEQALQIMRTY